MWTCLCPLCCRPPAAILRAKAEDDGVRLGCGVAAEIAGSSWASQLGRYVFDLRSSSAPLRGSGAAFPELTLIDLPFKHRVSYRHPTL